MELDKEKFGKLEQFINMYFQMLNLGCDKNMILNKDISGNEMLPYDIFIKITESELTNNEFCSFLDKIKNNNNSLNNNELILYNHFKSYIYKLNTRFDNIRNTILSEFLNKEYNTKLKDPYDKYVYDNQKETAYQIMNYIFDNDVKAVTLVALPQAGKTGTFAYCTYLALTHCDNNKIYEPENIFIISGLNDIDWQEQTEKDMMPSLKNNVYHLGKLKVFNEQLKLIANSKIFIIIDECQVATSSDQTIDRILSELEKNISNGNEIKYLVVSATPSVILYDLKEWGGKHKTVFLNIPPIYTGFENFLNEGRIYEAGILSKEFLDEQFKPLLKDRFKEPKYHIVRISQKKRDELETWIVENKYEKKEIDSQNKIDNINDYLQVVPKNHTFLIIKNYWRAGKRMNDKNVGIVYEYSNITNYDVTAQGLIGRFCGTNKQKNGPTAPIFFCKKDALTGYINFIKEDCEYSVADYHSLKIKVVDNELEKKTKSIITKITKVSIKDSVEHNHIKKQDYIDPPRELMISDNDYLKIDDEVSNNKKSNIFKNILKEKYKNIFDLIENYNCDKCTIPKADANYKRHIIDARKACEDKKLYLADIAKETKDEYKNSWVVFIDHLKNPKDGTHKVYLVVYHGERRKKLLEESKKKVKQITITD